MTTLSRTVADSATMLRRNLKRARRYPVMTGSMIGVPVVFLVLFVGVLGGVLGAGLGAAAGGADYVDFLTPGILVLTVASGCTRTAVAVCMDMTEGIIDRSRTMAIARASVLTGHVLNSFIQTVLSLVLVVGVALLMGFRPSANVAEWIAAIGLLALATVALTWIAVAAGLVAKNPEGASNVAIVFVLLPFFGSGFVPTESMPAAVRWFAAYQPFTPIMDTLRGLLTGTEIGTSALLAVAWCAGLTLVGYLGALAAYDRRRAR